MCDFLFDKFQTFHPPKQDEQVRPGGGGGHYVTAQLSYNMYSLSVQITESAEKTKISFAKGVFLNFLFSSGAFVLHFFQAANLAILLIFSLPALTAFYA